MVACNTVLVMNRVWEQNTGPQFQTNCGSKAQVWFTYSGQKTLNSKLWATWENSRTISVGSWWSQTAEIKRFSVQESPISWSRNMISPSRYSFKIALKRTHLCLCWHCDQLITLWSRLLQDQGPVEEAGCIRPCLFYNSISANGYECSQWHTKNTKCFQFC
jgi:hypothetical protein